MKKINILGHNYKVLIIPENKVPEYLKEKHNKYNGLCENFSNELIIFQDKPTGETYRRMDLMQKKVARHELFHAYFHKSGLSRLIDKDTEEAIVDMLAINFENIKHNIELIMAEMECQSD